MAHRVQNGGTQEPLAGLVVLEINAASLETLVGPVGTGKSFVIGVLAKAWQDPALSAAASRRAFGLAASQIATEVLAGEGLEARNIARWLASQERLAAGTAQGMRVTAGAEIRR